MSPIRCAERPATCSAGSRSPPMTLKGKAEPVSAFALTGSKRHASAQAWRLRAADRRPLGGARCAGRPAGRGALRPRPDRRHLGRGRHGEVAPGRPSSREWPTAAASSSHSANASRTARNTSYFVWREIWSTLFGSTTPCRRPTRCACWKRASRRSIPRWRRGRRCSAASSTCRFPTTSSPRRSTRSCARLRSRASLAECLRARPSEVPLVIVLEDCHWLDPLSRDLLEVLARAAAGLSVLLVLAYRPGTQVGGGLGLEQPAAFRGDRARRARRRSTPRS